jgi:hypothetical protein
VADLERRVAWGRIGVSRILEEKRWLRPTLIQIDSAAQLDLPSFSGQCFADVAR